MRAVSTPIVVAEGRDVTLFDSVAEAEVYLELIDVADGAFRGYDAEGRSLEIGTDGDLVRIRAAEEAPGHADELGELLRGILEHVGEPAEPDRDLPSLVAACDRFREDTPDSFRAVLAGFFDDLWRSARGRELRRRGR